MDTNDERHEENDISSEVKSMTASSVDINVDNQSNDSEVTDTKDITTEYNTTD